MKKRDDNCLLRKKPLPFEFPGANWFDRQEERAALRVIRAKSPFRYYGPKCGFEVDRLEDEFARVNGVKHALAVSSGTQALATAMAALGIGPGAEVIVPAYMWIAIVASIVRLGAIPVLADIDDSFTLDPRRLEQRITRRTRLIVGVHMSGAPADMAAILKVARRHKIPVLEDCAQCNGGSFRGRQVGSMGTLGIFSFQLNKNMTTGEGGMLVTNSTHLFRRASAIHDLGYPRIGGRLVMENGPYALWGFGGRLNEIAGAIGRVQLKKLPLVVAAMRKAKAQIKKGVADIQGLTFRRLNDTRGDTAAFLIMMLPDAGRAGKFAKALNADNIFAGMSPTLRVADFGMHVYFNIHSLVEKHSNSPDGFPWTLPANKHSVYSYTKGALPVSDALMERSVIMPIPSVMTGQDIQDTISAIRKAAAQLL
ncbi:MAG: DegT/DnrJ/EryC1/StrS family aminotransferase [Verrucomicrobia bacterium]|nr:DegT/DnrJ/EryC1/StrS family aminotransferase [Verrucomicrobiota bacterium]MBU4291041.1 DegT/DnrJ/EryC1/StrS family aminotransferase [Verrucomicrobiota bacterium]MBU4429342.1 DegT/DnrJ/EryC1/StrS family aminotransferase [Verrucomicrobiota bacterium]MBU4498332.1 DegT/DnrJ/EryC1/StrS family aminotransferase [Verrucomicrobiota bacterium]MCG2679437.1 DegT/DnrJ/EryC1/StrS family aminotransferase [Kiritimatiellia bacterium]